MQKKTMKRKLISKKDQKIISRNKRLITFRKKHLKRIADGPAIDNSFDKLALIHTEIMGSLKILRKGYKSFRLAKLKARIALAEATVFLEAACYSLGLVTHDQNIISRTKATPAYILGNSITEPKLISLAKDVIKIAGENIGSMKMYLVTPETVADARKKTADYENSIKALNEKRKEIIEAKRKLMALASLSSTVVKQELNTGMLAFVKTDPEMYKEYKLAASIPEDKWSGEMVVIQIPVPEDKYQKEVP